MALLEVGRMRSRYRLPTSRLKEAGRLDRILHRMLEGDLEHALVPSGLQVHGLVCLRRLDVRVRVRLGSSDAAIAAAWSRAIAASMRAALAGPESVLVSYESIRHALLDMALGSARGRLDRAWAWRRLGIFPGPASVGVPAATEAVVKRLEEEPASMLPLLREAARAGWLRQLLDRISAFHWERLAAARAAASGLSWEVLVDATRRGAAGGETRRSAAPDVHASHAQSAEVPAATIRLAASSPLLPYLDAAPGLTETWRARLAAAVLISLDAEPGLAAHGPVAAGILVGQMVALLRQRLSAPSPAPVSPPVPEPPPGANEGGPSPAPGAPEAAGAVAEACPARGTYRAESQAEVAEPLPEDPRRRAWTEVGGLLFLVHLVDRLETPDRLVAAAELRQRDLRWSLHRLAVALTGVAEDDPAALAFCGLGPDAPPPSRDQPPPSEPELAVVVAIAEELARDLADALERRQEPAEAVLGEVCRRRAEVVADLGWIDVLLELEGVSLEIRRAGLDLDPGWVPWLGVVLRFVYG